MHEASKALMSSLHINSSILENVSSTEASELAYQLYMDGHFSEAEVMYQEILQNQPDSAENHKNHGNTLLSLGRLEEAEKAYRQSIILKPDYPEAYNNLGNVLRLGARLNEAELAFQKALDLMPNSAEILNNFGNVLMDLGRLSEAENAFRKAIILKSDYAMAYNNRGNALQALGRLDVAQKCHRKTLTLKPDYVEAYIGLGQDLMLSGKPEEAEQMYRQAITIKPDFAEAYFALGIHLEHLERIDEAEQVFRYAIKLKPEYVEAHIELGNILQYLGRFNDAEQSYHQTLIFYPDYAIGKFNISILYLLQGHLTEGFKLYEQRSHIKKITPNCVKSYIHLLREDKRWNGGQSKKSNLLIISEQGAGDLIMMMRYIPLLKEQGINRLTIYCEPQMMRVFQSISVVDEVVCTTEPLPVGRCDYYCFIMSLPYLFQTHLDSIPDKVPYLVVPEKMRIKWHADLESTTGFKVGLVWAGNSDHASDKKRSIPLSTFSILREIKGVQLVSLQKGDDAGQLKSLGWDLIDWMDMCNDYLDTAALVSELDLVISVDTSVAHLTGALGKPVWLLNRFESEWRWMLDRPDSPWYPSMKIFRQAERGDWKTVINSIAVELSNMLNFS